MGTLLTYDVKQWHATVKNDMKQKGYVTWLLNTESNKNIDLPNTTLYHANKSQADAISDLKSVCNSNNAGLEKAIAVAFNSTQKSTWESY